MADAFSKELIVPYRMNCTVYNGFLAYAYEIYTQDKQPSHCIGCRLIEGDVHSFRNDADI